MGSIIPSTDTLCLKSPAKKPVISIKAPRDNSENSPITNGRKSVKAKVAKALPVAPLSVRRSERVPRPTTHYHSSVVDSTDFMVTKPTPKSNINGKISSFVDPKSKYWDPVKFLLDDSLVPVTNLDAKPPKGFGFIVNNVLRDPSTYRPDKSNHVSKPRQKAPRIHPRLLAHIKNGTATMANRLYYEKYEPGQINPIAGLFSEDNPLPPARLKRRRPLPRSYDEVITQEIVEPDSKRIKFTSEKKSKSPPKKVSEKATEIAIEKKVHFEKKIYHRSEVRERLVKTTNKMLPRIDISEPVMEKRDFNYLQEESFHNRPSINLVIPDHIKAILVDDWENVTKAQLLVPLPHKKSVNQILDDWLESEKPKRPIGSAQADILEEIVAGLKDYFEKSLGRILLYRFERQQYTDFRQIWDDEESEQKCASDTYGAEHLCRLLVTLPELIAQTNMDLQSVNRLREELGKLTSWIGKNAKDYFVNEYEAPGVEYTEKARSNV
ncbi:hypothetical protein SBOR_6732 [Sclerotinia borealis F-4128]|uniref:Chromatin modification-related protein EAF3 n=1 Tax=Sclerotinia borealis (strain F-4128) TaxID=1432307 RepID=W9CDI9_SCLBF|nr:hypothetical protein SBOR_6732 [Sclerotinia borealis F-4128]